MTVNKLRDTPYISVPTTRVSDARPSHVSIKIEKLAGMYDLEHLEQDINSSLKGALSEYAVVTKLVSDNGLFYEFTAEDIGTDKTFRPATITDFKQATNYHIKLQENLVLNIAERGHIAIFGMTGAGKTATITNMMASALYNGWDLYILDGKGSDLKAFELFYPTEKIATNKDKAIELVDKLITILEERGKIANQTLKETKKSGLNGQDIGFRPIILVADELGSLIATMESGKNKEADIFIKNLSRLIMVGRGLNCLVWSATQDPSADTLPTKIRSQFQSKILLGSASDDVQRMALGQKATDGNVKKFRGFYVSDGLTVNPRLFYVPDMYANGFNELDRLEELYKIGLTKIEEYKHK